MTPDDRKGFETAFHAVSDRISAMLRERGDRAFSRAEDIRYARLVRELAEISTAMHEARRRDESCSSATARRGAGPPAE